MSLSPLVSFKSRFVTYLLNFPRKRKIQIQVWNIRKAVWSAQLSWNEISGSHCSNYEDCCLQGCDKLVPFYQQDKLKHRYTPPYYTASHPRRQLSLRSFICGNFKMFP